MLLGKWTAMYKRMKLEYFLMSYTKIIWKWIKDLNVRPETIKLLEKNRQNTWRHKSQQDLLWLSYPRVMEIKTNKWNQIKLETICTVKETINKVKRQPPEFKAIIAGEITDKGSISKIYKQLMQLNTRKVNNSNKKWDLNRHFSKDIQKANKHMKMLNIAHYQRNEDQNYNEISPHPGQNGHHQKICKQ